MIFKDYYLILQIPFNATLVEIKKSFKELALKWHPDKNIGYDTTKKMQDLNEAYLILKDIDARKKYDIEYVKYYQFKNHFEKEYETNVKAEDNYKFADQELWKWIQNARQQSVALAKQTIKEVGSLTIDAGAAAISEVAVNFGCYFVIAIIIFLIMFILSLF